MAFADPQSVTYNSVATSLPRISSGPNQGIFSQDTGAIKLSISHTTGKRNRFTVRLDHRKVASDPFVTGLNTAYSMSVYMVVDVPPTGYTIAEQKYLVDALTAYLTASSGAKVTQLLGQET